MLIFKRKKINLVLLILIFRIMTSSMTERMDHNLNNYSVEYINFNIFLDGWNASQQDANNSNTMVYETVVVGMANSMDIYFTPCLIAFGISGNMLALYVFYASQLRYHSTSQYLSALAISDSVFLAELLPPWLSTMGITGIFHRDAYCKCFVYISYVTCSLSSWLVIAFTIERFVAIQYPLQRPYVCTVRRARYIIAALTVGALLVNLPVILFAAADNQTCNIDREKLEQAAKFNWVDTTVTFTIPLILIIFFNTWIAAAIYKFERDRIKLTQEELRAAASMGQHKIGDSDFIYLRSQRRITNMLLFVSSTFVMFNCPAYTLRVCGYAYNLTHPLCHNWEKRLPHKKQTFTESAELDDKWLSAQNVATMMFNMNFGINFFLYCLTGQNFRRALVQTVPWCGWIARKTNALFNRSTVNQDRTCSVTTTSAASTGTDAACTDMPFGRPITRRRRPRNGNYIMRWTFDNRRQRRETVASGAPDLISMHEIVSQPGPSRVIVDERPLPGSSRDHSSVRTRAVIESTRSTIHHRAPAHEPRRDAIEQRRPAAEARRPGVESRQPDMEPRRYAIASRRSEDDSIRPATESRRPVLSRVVVAERRKTCCL